MEYSYKFRLYPTKAQEQQMQRTFGCCRYVYNHYLAQRIDAYRQDGQTVNYYDCCKDLTQLKHTLEWLREVDSTALRSSLRDLDIAYQNFFRRVKKGGEKPGFPKFKSRKSGKKSYKSRCTGTSIRVLDKAVQLPKLGAVKCRISKKVQGRILSATVSQNPSGKYLFRCAVQTSKWNSCHPPVQWSASILACAIWRTRRTTGSTKIQSLWIRA